MGRELGNNRGNDPKANVEALKAAGINSRFYISPDTAREWQTWRRSLREFAPLLFQHGVEFSLMLPTLQSPTCDPRWPRTAGRSPSGDRRRKARDGS